MAPYFGRHVGDGGPVGERQRVEAGPVEFHELADHAPGAQHFDHAQHEVGGGGALRHAAGELEAHHFRDQHGDRLAQHGGLRLDAADAPAEHAEPVHHGGVAVRADHGVGHGDGAPALFLGPDRAGQIFEIDLVADAGAGRHDAEVTEGGLAPAQELVTLAVALELAPDIGAEGIRAAVAVHHDRVVDDEVHRAQRVDLLRVAAELGHGVAHGGKIDHSRHAGEVLHQHARGPEGDLGARAALLQPGAEARDVIDRDRAPVLVPEQVLGEDAQRDRQARKIARSRFRRFQRVIVIVPAADPKGPARTQGVASHDAKASRLPKSTQAGVYTRTRRRQRVGGEAGSVALERQGARSALSGIICE